MLGRERRGGQRWATSMHAQRVLAPTHRRDGVPEGIITTQTMRKDGKGPLKNPKTTEIWRPHCAQPSVHGRHLDRVEGKRHLRRPSAVAIAGGKRRITELDGHWPDEYEGQLESEDDEPMPDEDDKADTGWRAGPASRERLPFIGRAPGPTNPDLSWTSSYTAVMNELITSEFKEKWVSLTLEHVRAWRAAHRGFRKNRTERTVRLAEKTVRLAGVSFKNVFLHFWA